jgi:hypothetical protein
VRLAADSCSGCQLSPASCSFGYFLDKKFAGGAPAKRVSVNYGTDFRDIGNNGLNWHQVEQNRIKETKSGNRKWIGIEHEHEFVPLIALRWTKNTLFERLYVTV